LFAGKTAFVVEERNVEGRLVGVESEVVLVKIKASHAFLPPPMSHTGDAEKVHPVARIIWKGSSENSPKELFLTATTPLRALRMMIG
jgi:hypothetical protein